jgi:hypothetical protein
LKCLAFTPVTAIDVTTEISQSESAKKKTGDDMVLYFVKKYAVLHIKDLDTKVTFDLCNLVNCDGRLHDKIFKKQWNFLGTTMPPNFYEKYVRVFKEATYFLESNNVSYYIYGGANVGILKFQRLLPWDSGDVDFFVDVESVGGCKKWLKMVKYWANSKNFKHPHVDPAGATCNHYGVYAVSPSTYVNDPYSMGLATFSNKMKKGEKTLKVVAHGTETRVPFFWVKRQLQKYGNSLLKHVNHQRGMYRCAVKEQYNHNCIQQSDGTHLDQCIEKTAFYS